jgi:hypothetical protein
VGAISGAGAVIAAPAPWHKGLGRRNLPLVLDFRPTFPYLRLVFGGRSPVEGAFAFRMALPMLAEQRPGHTRRTITGPSGYMGTFGGTASVPPRGQGKRLTKRRLRPLADEAGPNMER